MVDTMAKSERRWGVICLHCGRPFPVPFSAASPAYQPTQEGAFPARGLFLAWCPVCDREAPYSVAEVVPLETPGALSTPVPFGRAAGAS